MQLASKIFLCSLTAGIVAPQAEVWAQSFDAALARCAQQVRFCEKESYHEKRCQEIPATLPLCNTDMTAGTLCVLKLQAIVPTQAAVGKHVAVCKAKRLQAKDEEDSFKDGLTRYLLRAKRHVPAVIGPENKAGGRFYITDHHHLSYAMNQARKNGWIKHEQDHVIACILTNRSTDKDKSFWNYMVTNHFTWLGNDKGAAITAADLRDNYTGLDKMENYAYRSWSRWVRDSCGYVKKGNDCVPAAYPATAPYFMEFKWADYLYDNLAQELSRQGIDIDLKKKIKDLSDADIDKVVKAAIKLVQDDQAFLQDLPGYSNGSVIKAEQVEIEDGCEVD